MEKKQYISFIILIITGLLNSSTSPIQAQKPSSDPNLVKVPGSYITGQRYLKDYSKREKMAYVTGLVDGMIASELMGGTEAQQQRLEQCIKYMSIEQLEAILTKFLEEYPERWHQPTSVSMYTALMVQLCPK